MTADTPKKIPKRKGINCMLAGNKYAFNR